ncbi:pirin family protein [Rhodococcus chondri]|uniref:Pirin family protein n=1 Tax=Rhodococcus chondri TaxID=3065941 RepID=A0ABU7JW46_9NOCA|nr:pirin family protein [Rhodococcus sp. CC-R104]MEE2033507.1 pirin family protein [Rhodococcus sp. CC-R104]
MTSMAPPVLQVFRLGSPWQTIDPFLFVAHHVDAYPAGNADLGPDAPLTGRPLGQDFGNPAGWNMYHGTTVPGFPGHPHRGFETVTFVRTGVIDHSDSVGAAARFGEGDTQWLTAGNGVVHSEMFPLLHRDRPNPLELFQIWLNLPAASKTADPHFAMLWNEETPTVTATDAGGRTVEVRVIAGTAGDVAAPPPPPESWAARAENDVAIWNIDLSGGATWTLPPAAGPDTQRVLYVYDGSPVEIGERRIDPGHGVVVDASVPALLAAGDDGTRILLLQGRPIGEPVVSYGPFVLNDEAGVQQAFEDYRRTGFGGWPWDRNDPVHPADAGRFARYPDGRVEQR